MNIPEKISPFEIKFILGLGLFGGIGYWLYQRYFPDTYYLSSLFFISPVFIILNWPLLNEKNRRAGRIRGIAAIITVSVVLLSGLAVHWSRPYFSYLVPPFYPFSLFFCATLITAFIVAYFCKKADTADDNIFHTVLHTLILRAGLYIGFLTISAIIFALGFALLHLLGFRLWKIMGEIGNAVFIALLCSSNLLFLTLIPLHRQYRSAKFLLVFPYITLGFACLYLAALPLTALPQIAGAARLTTALILWAFMIYLHDIVGFRLKITAAAVGILLTLISLHGVLVRIDAYGLTDERIYVLCFIGLLILNYVGLLLQAVAEHYLPRSLLCRQTLIGTLLISAFLFVIFALLPVRQWSLNSQIRRFTVGGADLHQLKPYQFSGYGKAGKDALAEIRHFYRNNPQALQMLENRKEKNQRIQKNFLTEMVRIPENLEFSASVQKVLLKNYHYYEWQKTMLPAFAVSTDANHDDKPELLVFIPEKDSPGICRNFYKTLFFPTPAQNAYFYTANSVCIRDKQAFIHALHEKQWHYTRPAYDNFSVNNITVFLP